MDAQDARAILFNVQGAQSTLVHAQQALQHAIFTTERAVRHAQEDSREKGEYTLRLNEYQATNLLRLLMVLWQGAEEERSRPLNAWNTGDWAGEIPQLLEAAGVRVPPTAGPAIETPAGPPSTLPH